MAKAEPSFFCISALRSQDSQVPNGHPQTPAGLHRQADLLAVLIDQTLLCHNTDCFCTEGSGMKSKSTP